MRISDWSSDVCSSDLVGTRHRDVVDRLLAEMEEVAQHLALDGREVADDAAAPALAPLLFGLVDRLLDLFAQARLAIAAEQQCLDTGQQAGSTVLFRSVRRSLVVGHDGVTVLALILVVIWIGDA